MPKITKKNKGFDEIIQDFLDYCNYKNLSLKTIKSYHQTLTLFFKYLEEEKDIKNVNKIGKQIVEEYIKFTQERGKYSFVSSVDGMVKANIDKRTDIGEKVSTSTLNNYLRNIKVFFSYLEENQIIRENTVKKCKYIKNERKSKEQLTDNEFNKLIKSMDLTKFHEYRDYVITNLIFDTGMRLNETLNLTINDVDFTRRTIMIDSEISKGRKDRVVFYSQTMSKLLQRWLRFKDTMQEAELLFPTQRTNGVLSVSNFERNFRIYLKRAKINKNITPHGLRNNFARRFLLASSDIHTLSKILGHSSVTVTEKAYLDLMDEDFRKKYQRYSPLENMKERY
ncbi:site-specific integrase [Clostridium botulinum]|uniref:tyrosine-type recombinase/integrase n=1 Tax=Clostridium sp. ZBS18 TaxID=2949967 RepID=UPI001D9708BE|nr:tyrosine-type recombinase/integrase [Clostridium sp. ZBS18]MBN1055813.1 site-specific integrase [Clostridium botulinum]